VCAGYKWLFGPYSIGFAYFSSFFDDGIPLEESWMNREESDNFSNLTQLQSNYKPLAQVCEY
jgi:selenocysteine lyase/cysteine desulfurase